MGEMLWRVKYYLFLKVSEGGLHSFCLILRFIQFFFSISTWWKCNLLVTSPSASCAVPAVKDSLVVKDFFLSTLYTTRLTLRPQGCSTCSCYRLQSQALWKSIQLHHHKIGLLCSAVCKKLHMLQPGIVLISSLGFEIFWPGVRQRK